MKTRILTEIFRFFYRQHCFGVSSLTHRNLENCQTLGSDDQICQTWKLMIGGRVMIITWSCLLNPSGSNPSAASRMCFSMIRSSKLVDSVLDLCKILCLYPTQWQTMCIQVFAVRSGGVTGVLVKGPDQNLNFRMEDRGPVISIKFSPDMNVLAIQRTNSSVEFVNYSSVSGLDHVEYSQSCKGKNATILGFVWTHGNEILVVTDHGVELFQVRNSYIVYLTLFRGNFESTEIICCYRLIQRNVTLEHWNA